MGRRIALLVFMAFSVCTLAVAQDNAKPGSADSEKLGCSSGEGYVAQPGKPTSAITPIFSELVMSPCPDGFHEAYQNKNGGHFILEMVLKGETVDHWTQMVTVTGVQGHSADPNVTARTRLELKANTFKRACPDTFSAKEQGALSISGHEAFVGWFGCGNVASGASPHSESAVIYSIKGTDDYYTIQWAERGPVSMQPLAFDAAKWGARLSRMNPIKVCPVVPGEEAPYPSCLNQK